MPDVNFSIYLVETYIGMARTKQTARKSSAGKAPRQQLATKAAKASRRVEPMLQVSSHSTPQYVQRNTLQYVQLTQHTAIQCTTTQLLVTKPTTATKCKVLEWD